MALYIMLFMLYSFHMNHLFRLVDSIERQNRSKKMRTQTLNLRFLALAVMFVFVLICGLDSVALASDNGSSGAVFELFSDRLERVS